MRLLRLLALIVVAAVIAMPSQAKKKQKDEPEITTIYVFGVSQNMADSTVYVTDIAAVNGATLLPHNVLKNFVYYSEQLQKYVEETYSQSHMTTAFFYARDRKKIEKKYAKTEQKIMKAPYRQPRIVRVAYQDFHFRVPILKTLDEE